MLPSRIVGSTQAGIALLLVALSVGCGGSGTAPSTPATKAGAASASALRAVVLVTVEGLGRDTLRSNAASAPILTELASLPGNDARTAYTPYPMLLPAMTSLMTGTAPRTHGVLDGLHRRAPAGLPTLAESFRDQGWTTAAIVASPLVSEASGLARGFETFDGAPGSSVAALRYYPQSRYADEVAGNGVRWLRSLPKERSALLWIQLSDLARPYDPTLGPIAEQAKTRIEALDEAVGRLRQALREPAFGASLLVVTADRGQLRGESGDLDGGFLLEPGTLELPLLLERVGATAPAVGPEAPRGLTGLAAYLCAAAGLTRGSLPAPPEEAPLAVSAMPWVSCRWSPAVATLQGDALWVFDGAWRRFGAASAGVEVPSAEVPAELAQRLKSIATELASPAPSGPAAVAALDAARRAGLSPAAEQPKVVTPEAAQRRTIVATLQTARALEALNRPIEAVAAYKTLTSGAPALLAALHDLTFLQASNTTTAEPTWKSMTALLATYGIDRMTLHGAAHAANAHGDRDLARALLLAYLEEIGDEPDALYDLACIASVKNDLPGAQSYLERAIEAGFIWWDWIEQDADLRNLRGSPGFATVMQKHGR